MDQIIEKCIIYFKLNIVEVDVEETRENEAYREREGEAAEDEEEKYGRRQE